MQISPEISEGEHIIMFYLSLMINAEIQDDMSWHDFSIHHIREYGAWKTLTPTFLPVITVMCHFYRKARLVTEAKGKVDWETILCVHQEDKC
jgi:hypothetical protein